MATDRRQKPPGPVHSSQADQPALLLDCWAATSCITCGAEPPPQHVRSLMRNTSIRLIAFRTKGSAQNAYFLQKFFYDAQPKTLPYGLNCEHQP